MARTENNPSAKPTTKKTTTSRAGKTGSTRSKKAASSPSRRPSAFKSVSVKKAEQPGNLLLRDMDPEVLKVLKARAKRAGRSLQQELHLALRRDVRRNFDEAVAISSSWRERLKGRDLPDSTQLLREDRSR